ncbi:MAG: phosphotransferase [Angustibacter sp.]
MPPRSPLQLAALATAAVPGLTPITVHPPSQPGTTYDVAMLTDDDQRRWVVRAPRRAVAAAGLDVEARLLPRIARHLPMPVPCPAGPPTTPSGDPCLVHPWLPGRALDVAALAAGSPLAIQVGRALAAIHEVDLRSVEGVGLAVYPAPQYRERRQSELDRAARSGQVPPSLLERWGRELDDQTGWQFAATLVHGDLSAEHVLVAEEALSGIIDWGAAMVADPADDLAWLTAHATPAALDTVFEAYAMARRQAPDPGLLRRARLVAELSPVRRLLHGVAAGDAAVVDHAEQALRDLADAADHDAVDHNATSAV